ncbi:MAG: hypothetical protein QT08_C0015G0033 [archaeon GW2011_AR17]|nr:MAG: hypothetical protein QT08_C0015G0033 [archaeon GW2011_AR17]
MSKEQQNSSKKNNILVKLSIWGINRIYRKYLKIWKAKKDQKKRKITICSYYPNCSEYGILALQKYGFFKGWTKTINRIFRCNKFQHSESCIDYP